MTHERGEMETNGFYDSASTVSLANRHFSLSILWLAKKKKDRNLQPNPFPGLLFVCSCAFF